MCIFVCVWINVANAMRGGQQSMWAYTKESNITEVNLNRNGTKQTERKMHGYIQM